MITLTGNFAVTLISYSTPILSPAPRTICIGIDYVQPAEQLANVKLLGTCRIKTPADTPGVGEVLMGNI